MNIYETVDDTEVNTLDSLFEIAGAELSFLVTDSITTRGRRGTRTTHSGVVLETGKALRISKEWKEAREKFEKDGSLLKKQALYFPGVPLVSITLHDTLGEGTQMPQFTAGQSFTLGEMALLVDVDSATTYTLAGYPVAEALCVGVEALRGQR